jgi:hypothetical protein
VQPLGQPLGDLHAEAVHEELLGELAVGFELGHELGDFLADGDRLQGDDVELSALARAEVVRDAQAVALGLPGSHERVSSVVRSSGSRTTMSLPSE